MRLKSIGAASTFTLKYLILKDEIMEVGNEKRSIKGYGSINRCRYRLTNLTGELTNLKVRYLIQLQKEPHSKSSTPCSYGKLQGLLMQAETGARDQPRPLSPHER